MAQNRKQPGLQDHRLDDQQKALIDEEESKGITMDIPDVKRQ